MNRRKAGLAGSLLAILALSVLAVSGMGTAGAAKQSAKKTVRVAVVVKVFNEYFLATRDGVRATDKKRSDLKVLSMTAGKTGVDADVQISLIEDALTRKPDALVVAPTGPQVLPVLKRAVKSGVKVILIDNDLPGWKGKTAYLGTNNYNGGLLAGKYLAKQMKGKGKLGVLDAIPGIPALDDRVKGMKAGLKGTSIKVVSQLATGCVQDKGVSATEDIITRTPDVDAIYAACGPPIFGAIKSLKAANIAPKDILLVGFDGLPGELQAIKKGDEDATVAQSPRKMGVLGLEYAIKAVRGQKVPKVTDTGTALVTKDNVSKF